MKNKKPFVILYIIIVGGGALYLGVHKYRQYKAEKQAAQASAELAASAPTPTDKLVSTYLDDLALSPGNVKYELELAGAYIQKARETADVSYYAKVDDLMDKAQNSDSKNSDIYALRGIVALARHHFIDGLKLGQQAVSLNPNNALYYGIIADAQTELGQNDNAVNSLQTMVNKHPDYSSFSRIAYARELHGDFEGAKQAIKTAVEEGASFPENVAWGYVELGKLDMRTDINAAQQQFNLALNIVPKYAPALEQLGKAAFAKNDPVKAQGYFQKAFDILPLAQYAIDQGEVYGKTGDTQKQSQQFALAQIAFEKSQSAGGVNTDMELSLFLSEHGLDPARALTLAEQSYKVRGSIYGADAIAWAYYKNNRPVDAQTYINQALRLGQNDPGIVFHAAMIAEQNNQPGQAKAYYKKVLDLNPNFSILYAGIAESKVK